LFNHSINPTKKIEINQNYRISALELTINPGTGFEHRTAEPQAERKNPDYSGSSFVLLEYIARFASTGEEKASARQLLRFKMQDQAGKILPGERVSKCLRHRIPIKARVEIWRSEKFKKAHYKNLMVCGSVWMCPVCASKITERRRVELEKVIQEKKFQKVMVTFTLQHKSWESLARLYQGLSESFRNIKSGRSWEVFEQEAGIIASIRGSEITWGKESGWHPHFHVVFFLERKSKKITREYKDWFAAEITQKYAEKVAKKGFYVSPEYGVKVSFDQDHVSAYAAKWGMDQELAKSPVKMAKGENLTPFQMLLESAKDSGQKELFENLFREYAGTMKSKKQLVWSKGAREIFALDQELTDQELAEVEEEKAVRFASLMDDHWKRIVYMAARGDLLQVAAAGDREKFSRYLVMLGIYCDDQDLFPQEVSMDYGSEAKSELQGFDSSA